MKKRKVVGEALFLSTVAAGFVLLSPDQADAAQSQPLLSNDYSSKTNQVLRYGYNNQAVKTLQLELKALKFYKGKIDGHFGPATQSAVKEFQFVHHIKVDGIAGPITLGRLYSSDPITYQQFTATKLIQGDKGEQVRQLQEKLSRLGYYSFPIDGSFGPITQRAVRDYQQKNGFKVNGVAGPTILKHVFSNKNVKGKKIVQKKVKKQVSFSVDTSIIKHATRLVGTPYRWGGTSLNGFDCSGFLQYVFSKKGVSIPRTVSDIWNFGVGLSKPSVGDIVFYQTYKKGPSHAGIYLGDGKFIHSGTKGVTISDMNISYWQKRYLGSKRMVQYN